MPVKHGVPGDLQLLAGLTDVVPLTTARTSVRNSGHELLIGTGNAGADHGKIAQIAPRVGGPATPYVCPAVEAVVGNGHLRLGVDAEAHPVGICNVPTAADLTRCAVGQGTGCTVERNSRD